MKKLKQSGLILSTIVCEFFSYFGIRALLILYLSQKLNFSDHHAYALFGAFTALIFLTPIAGGYLADRYLGFYRSVFIGAVLIILGEFCLVGLHGLGFYVALALLVLGLGFFKTNAICLYQQCLKPGQSKNSAMSIYYVALNTGGSLGPIINGFVAEAWGFEWAFILATLVMILGLLSLRMAQSPVDQPKLSRGQAAYIFGGLLIAIILTTVVLYKLWAGYLVLIAVIIAMIGAVVIYQRTPLAKKQMRYLLLLTLLSTVYWVLDQQGGSSVMLFISRSVDRAGIPTASFSGMSSLGTIIFGLLLAWVWQRLARTKRDFSSAWKLLIGFVFLGAGFAFLTGGALLAVKSGQCSWIFPMAGLAFISMGELFTDPVIISEIAQSMPLKNLGFFTGMYFLFVGAVANYAAGWLAQVTAISKKVLATLSQTQVAEVYSRGFMWMLVSVGVALLLVVVLALTKNNK